MLKPASLKRALRYPVTASVALAALAVSAYWWSGKDVDRLIMDGEVWENWQLWRALSCVLVHVNLFHLAFNLYWFWVFGTFVESVYGHLRFAGILVLLALCSSLMEFAVFSGGVGLSGVGYGLWGMLWVLNRRDARFAGTIDRQTNLTWVAWFFLCIALTFTGAMPVGNVAHGTGALAGALLGLAATGGGAARWRSNAALAIVLICGLAGSTIFWPHANFSSDAEAIVERAGVDALQRDENARATKLLETSAHMKGSVARTWFNLGIAYQSAKRYKDALAAYEHAARMPDADSDVQKAAQAMKDYLKLTKER